MRFAVSPLGELGLALRAWRDPGLFPLHLRWLRKVDAVRSNLDSAVLFALTNERGWTPDFLNPRPRSPLARLDDELGAIDASVVRRDLRAVHGDTLPPALRGSPARVLRRIVDALDKYWQLCFAPYWPRMRALLDGDITYRGQQIAQRGLAAMFAQLSPTVRLVDHVVEVRLPRSGIAYTRRTTDGLTLVPTLWTHGASARPLDALPPLRPGRPPGRTPVDRRPGDARTSDGSSVRRGRRGGGRRTGRGVGTRRGDAAR